MTTLESGSTLHDTYRLLEPLGRGGMGVVWRAQHVRLPKEMAIKVLNEAAYESEEILHRFRREAEITSSLGHPHIVEVFDFNVLDDGRAYLVMELLQGESLRERLRRGPMAPKEALEVLRQVGSALARAHEAGIIHRDLKPENIFLCAADRPFAKVLDFGISKIQGSQTVVTQESSLLGTPKYMSPEQAKGENSQLDARTDQFSLGAIAYEMLTGQAAFAGDSVTAVLYKVLYEEPTAPPEDSGPVPPAVDSAIRRALAKDRDARFSSVAEFLDAITTEPSRMSPFSGPAAPAEERSEPNRGSGAAAASGPAGPERGGDDGSGARAGGDGGSASVPATPRPASKAPLVAVALLGVAGAGWWLLTSRGPAVVSRPLAAASVDAGATADPDGASAGGVDAAVVAAASDAGAEEDATEASARASGDGAAADDGASRPRPRRGPTRISELGPELKRAMAALEAQRWEEAKRLARRGLADGEGPYAFAVLAIAACGEKDLSGANAAYRRVLRRDRRRVRAACRNLGFTMGFAAD